MLDKLTRSNGQGNITPTGYIRVKVKGKLYMQHKLVWQQRHGDIPQGYDVHHKDGDKQNNDINNLELLTRQDHIRKHKGWYRKGQTWIKPCTRCNRHLEVTKTNFFFTTENNKNRKPGELLFGKCKRCHIEEVDRVRQAKKTSSRSFAYSA